MSGLDHLAGGQQRGLHLLAGGSRDLHDLAGLYLAELHCVHQRGVAGADQQDAGAGVEAREARRGLEAGDGGEDGHTGHTGQAGHGWGGYTGVRGPHVGVKWWRGRRHGGGGHDRWRGGGVLRAAAGRSLICTGMGGVGWGGVGGRGQGAIHHHRHGHRCQLWN